MKETHPNDIVEVKKCDRIHLSKRVTAINEKDQGKQANIFKDDIKKLHVLLLKSYPQEFIKACIEKSCFKLMRNTEVHEAAQWKLLLDLPLNVYKKLQRIMIRFGYDQKFFPSHHCISAEQKNLAPHITKEIFVIEKMYLNINAEPRKKVSVLVAKDLYQYTESIAKNLEQQGKLKFDGFDDYFWLLFSRNKGGKLIKFHFEVI